MAEEAVKEVPALLDTPVVAGAGEEAEAEEGGAAPLAPIMVKAGEYEMGLVLASSE